MKNNLLIAAGIALGLSACSSTGTLQSPQADTKVNGTLTRGLVEPHRIEINLDGKIYRGEWRTSDPTKEQKAETSYPHQKHIGQVRSTLKASDGGVLDCQWDTHGDAAEGNCTTGGRTYPLILK